eukprot:scaffold61572_cov23-Cyclotella_meneghiniana.AAC.3
MPKMLLIATSSLWVLSVDPNSWTEITPHTYVEIGAHRWKGLLVEPHPKNYERTVELRPNAHHLNVVPSCMSNSTRTINFPSHIYTSAQVNETGSELEIHCGLLQHYLDALSIPRSIRHIDFGSLDVEGKELHVLQTVNFEHTHIEVIIAESDN